MTIFRVEELERRLADGETVVMNGSERPTLFGGEYVGRLCLRRALHENRLVVIATDITGEPMQYGLAGEARP